MIVCNDCKFSVLKDITVYNDNFIKQPEGTKYTHLEAKLYCAYYPKWILVEHKHYCSKGILK